MRAVTAGHVPITISGLPPVVELIKADKLLAVAVTSAKRSAVFPNVVALAELGTDYKDFDLTNWFGFFDPGAVPEDIRKRLIQTAVAALKEATVIARIAEQGAEVVGNSPEEFATFIRAEAEKYARIAKATGVRANP
jgi:tripartite-type tricarboxylate transporter receptor subunit TctC